MKSQNGDFFLDLIEAVAKKDWEAAIRSAALMNRPESIRASRALESRRYPEVYMQMGKSIPALWEDGIAAATALAAKVAVEAEEKKKRGR